MSRRSKLVAKIVNEYNASVANMPAPTRESMILTTLTYPRGISTLGAVRQLADLRPDLEITADEIDAVRIKHGL